MTDPLVRAREALMRARQAMAPPPVVEVPRSPAQPVMRAQPTRARV